MRRDRCHKGDSHLGSAVAEGGSTSSTTAGRTASPHRAAQDSRIGAISLRRFGMGQCSSAVATQAAATARQGGAAMSDSATPLQAAAAPKTICALIDRL